MVFKSTIYEPVLTDQQKISKDDENGNDTIDNFRILDSENNVCSDNVAVCRKDQPRPKPPRKHIRSNSVRGDSQENCKNASTDSATVSGIRFTKDYFVKNTDACVQTLSTSYRLVFWPQHSCKLFPCADCRLKSKSCCLFLTRCLLSQIGLIMAVIIWTLAGAFIFYKIEGPREQAHSAKLAKIQKNLSLELYAYIEQNQNEFVGPATLFRYFEKHQKLLLDAISPGSFGGSEGKVWTYPGCVLFAVSLLTALGFGAPLPETTLGRFSAVLFALLGLPFNFLLIVNIGNLVAAKLHCCCRGTTTFTELSTVHKTRCLLKYFPFVAILSYYFVGVIAFGFVRGRDFADSFMFPLDFTGAGGVATIDGAVRVCYAVYLELAVILATVAFSVLQSTTARCLVDFGLKLGLVTNC